MRPHLIVLHYTAMADVEAALARLCDPASEVSAHYLIRADGALCSLVDEAERAWHAGAGAWGRCSDVNSASIGIELDHAGEGPFSEPQTAALEALLDRVMARWNIGPEGVIGHQDMAPGRKSDPGPLFPWKRLAEGGRAVWPEAATPDSADWSAFQAALRQFGYPALDGDGGQFVFDAFRARFRPAAGAFDATDTALARDLAARFPVDRAGSDT